jgi:hypothetical protein
LVSLAAEALETAAEVVLDPQPCHLDAASSGVSRDDKHQSVTNRLDR